MLILVVAWDVNHILASALVLLALERAITGHLKMSAFFLASAVFTAVYPVFILPFLLIYAYDSGRIFKTLQYSAFFIFSCVLWFIPWYWSLDWILQRTGALNIATRMLDLPPPYMKPFASISYLEIAIPLSLENIWSLIVIPLSVALALLFFSRLGADRKSNLLRGVLILLMCLYITYPVIFITYLVWALPLLIIAFVCYGHVPKRFFTLFSIIPILWYLWWNPLATYTAYQPGIWQQIYWPLGYPSNNTYESAIFRHALAISFSIVCGLILISLVRARTSSRSKNQELHQKPEKNSKAALKDNEF
jgi:hypothetical protein